MKRIKLAVLVDDDTIEHKLYTRVLEKSGLVDEIKSFYYADEFLEFLKGDDVPHIDVIFLDINMPRMTGFEFLETAASELGREYAKMVVVMLTNSLLPEERVRAETIDIVKMFLEKPLTIDNVQQISEMLPT